MIDSSNQDEQKKTLNLLRTAHQFFTTLFYFFIFLQLTADANIIKGALRIMKKLSVALLCLTVVLFVLSTQLPQSQQEDAHVASQEKTSDVAVLSSSVRQALAAKRDATPLGASREEELNEAEFRQQAYDPPLHRPKGTRRGNVHKEANRMVGEYGWVFQRYVPSKLELDFYDAVAPYARSVSWKPLIEQFRPRIEKMMRLSKGRVAPHTPFVRSDDLAVECTHYVFNKRRSSGGSANETTAVGVEPANRATCLDSTEPMDDDTFSKFEYVFRCIEEPCDPRHLINAPYRLGETHVSYIEPLVGLLRHPQVFLDDAKKRDYVENKEYMIVDKWALHHLYTRWKHPQPLRSHYFDLGASMYLSGAGGSSQVWFVGLSECMCVPFTSMRLWEAKVRPVKKLWDDVPGHLHPYYQWYNHPLSVDTRSWKNPLNHLIETVNPGEPVFMKVDFDALRLERVIIDTILERQDLLSGLIDELFFEHHVVLGGMTFIWEAKTIDRNATARESIDLFVALRNLGIRAHPWV